MMRLMSSWTYVGASSQPIRANVALAGDPSLAVQVTYTKSSSTSTKAVVASLGKTLMRLGYHSWKVACYA